MVGSITFLKHEGEYAKKGDEVCVNHMIVSST